MNEDKSEEQTSNEEVPNLYVLAFFGAIIATIVGWIAG
jgi:hypothetical protein